jgi:hypothetical protein
MINALNQLHDKASASYLAGCREPSQILPVEDLEMLAKLGVAPQFLYDAVDDLVRYGEPGKAVFVQLAQMRADHFQTALQGRPPSRIFEERELPLKSAEFQGVSWLPRIIRKAQCFLEGSLCDDIMYGCAGDRSFLKKYNATLPSFLAVVRDTHGDPAQALRFLELGRVAAPAARSEGHGRLDSAGA